MIPLMKMIIANHSATINRLDLMLTATEDLNNEISQYLLNCK